MIEVPVPKVIAAPPDDVLEFVMDIERYQQVDPKIEPVEQVSPTAARTEFSFRPKLGGIRRRGPTTRAGMQLTPGDRVEITRLHNPFRLNCLIEPILRRRLPAEVEEELQRAKVYLDVRPR